jgi:hypothetical protein
MTLNIIEDNDDSNIIEDAEDDFLSDEYHLSSLLKFSSYQISTITG